MLRSRTVNTIHDLATQGKSIRQIARELNLAQHRPQIPPRQTDCRGSAQTAVQT